MAQRKLTGGKFRHGFLAAGLAQKAAPWIDDLKVPGEKTAGVIARTLAASVAGGTASVLGGGKFKNGAITAGFFRLYNEEIGRMAGASKVAKQRKAELAPGVHDRHLTLDEARYWYQNGQGQSVFFDLPKVNFGTVSRSADFPNGVDSSEFINLLTRGTVDGLVLGTLRFTLNQNGTVTAD